MRSYGSPLRHETSQNMSGRPGSSPVLGNEAAIGQPTRVKRLTLRAGDYTRPLFLAPHGRHLGILAHRRSAGRAGLSGPHRPADDGTLCPCGGHGKEESGAVHSGEDGVRSRKTLSAILRVGIERRVYRVTAGSSLRISALPRAMWSASSTTTVASNESGTPADGSACRRRY